MNSLSWSNEQYHSTLRPFLLRELVIDPTNIKNDPFPLGPELSNPQVVMSNMEMSSFVGMTGVEAAEALMPVISKLHDHVGREHCERRRKFQIIFQHFRSLKFFCFL